MAIDWIYDTTYVSFGVDWGAAYKAVGKVTIQPRIYRRDSYNTADSSSFDETLRYEPNGSTGSWTETWGSGSGTRNVDTFGVRTYERRASAYTVRLEIETSSGFGTAYDGYYHTIGVVSRTATYTVPALPPAFNTLSATRVSDNQVNLSWTAASGNIGAVCIERSADGGSYSEVAVIWNASATSWQDNATTADHSYTYRARYHHEGAYGSYSNTVTVTMTPAAPQTISTAAAGGINIDVTLTNPSPVATKVQYEVSTNDGSTWGATQESASLTSFSVSASGTVKIRARNVYDGAVPALVSDWLTSDTIVTICPPAAPTLISPVGVLNLAAGSDVTFSWQHNPIDGSAQTAAKLAYSTDGGDTWTTVSMDPKTTGTYTMAIPWSVGTTVTWQMCTKGADASYGPWSSPQQFNVYTAPTLSITSPGATITGMPISLNATYSDMAGFTCQAATVSLMKDGRTLYSESATINGTSITSSLDVSEFLPTNGETYTVVLTARSSSGLQTTANATFTVDFIEPQAGELQITNDPDTGYASLLATFDNSASEITYTGSTNAQYESSEGYVRSLTVEGKSERMVSRNLLPKMVAGTYSGNGVTIVVDGDGVATMSGTTTASGNAAIIPLESSIVVTDGLYLHLNNSVANANVAPAFERSSGGGGISPAFTPANRIYAIPSSYVGYTIGRVRIWLTSGVTLSGTFAPMISTSSAATAYEPHFDPYLVSIEGVSVRGRNLLPLKFYDGIGYNKAAGAQITATDATGIVQSGDTFTRSVGSWGGVGMISDPLPNGTYKLSGTIASSGMRYTAYALKADMTVSRNMGNYSSPNEISFDTIQPFTLSGDEVYFAFHVGSNVSGTVNITAPQITQGSTPHAYEPYSLTTITTPLRSAGSIHDQLIAGKDEWTVSRKVGTRAYQSGDESDPDVLTDGTTTYYALATPTQDPETSMDIIEIGSAFTVATDLDSAFEMTTWDGSADAESISVSRVNADGTLTPLLTDGASGSGIVDKYAPLNTDYQYAVTTKAASQAVKTVYVTNRIDSLYWFAYWGENIAKAKWNPENGGIQVTRPQKTRVYYAGRRDPVSYDGHAVALTETPSWTFIGKDEVDVFVKLIEDGGRGVYKSCDGWVYHADFDLTLTPSYTAIGYYGGASLSITRIAGDRL